MKRFLSAVLLVFLIASLAACSAQPTAPAESAEPAVPAAQPAEPSPGQAPAAPPEIEAPAPPEPKAYAPEDIFGADFNPYYDVKFPDNFTIFAASFIKGAAKLEGKTPYTLSMTASGKAADSIAFVSALAGLSEEEKAGQTDEYARNSFCDFQGKDGASFTIRKTIPEDDRYEYVEGCLIEIDFDITADIEKYTDLARDNYSSNALSDIEEYLGAEPDWKECGFGVNLHKKEAGCSVAYRVPDAGAALRKTAENVESDWYDEQNAKMGLTYGIIRVQLEFDGKGGAVYVSQTASEFDTVLSEYAAPEFSLTKFGFGFGQDGVCGVYEQHEPHYMSIAIHRPEWGEFADDWNIEFMDQVNGYGLRITYHAAENKYRINADKNNSSASFEYFPADGKYDSDHPDKDTVARVFNDAFGTKGEDYREKPLAHFEQLVKERFGMSVEELYALPVR